MGRKLGRGTTPPFGEGSYIAGSHLTQSRLGMQVGRGLPRYQVGGILIHPAIWPQQIWAENWGVPLWGEGGGLPSNTMWPGPRPTCMASFILIYPTVWLEYTNVTDRTDRQTDSHTDRHTDRQWSDSIGRTVLQTAAQND